MDAACLACANQYKGHKLGYLDDIGLIAKL